LADGGQRELLWGDAADPDGDGIPNLAEYFGGLTPLVADPVSGMLAPVIGRAASVAWSVPMAADPDVRATAYVQRGDSPEFWERFYQAEATPAEGVLGLATGNAAGHGVVQYYRVAFEED
jgi:hypothetical protein